MFVRTILATLAACGVALALYGLWSFGDAFEQWGGAVHALTSAPEHYLESHRAGLQQAASSQLWRIIAAPAGVLLVGLAFFLHWRGGFVHRAPVPRRVVG